MLDLKKLFPDQLTESCYIEHVSADSTAVMPDSVFVALKGERSDGHRYVRDAFNNGAIVAIVEAEDPTIPGLQIVVPDTQRAVSKISAALYPWEQPMRFIGITGTDGKTSTSVFLEKLLNGLGHSVGYIGTNGISYAGKEKQFNGTTPLAVDLFPILSDMSRAGVEFVVMEVSSHALVTQRVIDLVFDYAVFTNFSHDHLDFHKTLEAYKEAKLTLFNQISDEGAAVINVDDDIALDVVVASEGHSIITYGLQTESADFLADDVSYGQGGMTFMLQAREERVEVTTKLIGAFNVYNILVAIAIAADLGYNMQEIVTKIKAIEPVPGRMELFYDVERAFTIIVDFGHAPNAIKHVLSVARELTTGRVIAVTGAVGDGDKAKRPLMADMAVTYADDVILTTDEPYSEEPEMIIAEMSDHLDKSTYRVVVDRKTAIKQALDEAEAGDVVVLLGRGRQTKIQYKDKAIEFSDYDFVKNYVSQKK